MRAAKMLVGGALGLTTMLGLVGVLHMPFARGILMRAGGCPVGRASLAQIEPARNAAIASQRGSSPAPSRPALGFELDRTTRDEARRWAERLHVPCKDVREGVVSCSEVPAAALGLPENDGPAGELHLGFNTRGVLVDVATMRTHVRPEPAADIESRLEATVGAPQQQSGSFDGASLAAAPAGDIATVRYRYSDYFAELIAMRFRDEGLVLREHYMSAM